MINQYTGTGVALITPMNNGAIDFVAFEKVINHVIEGGVDYLVVLGSTGEMATLNEEEARMVLDFVIRINNSRLPVVAGNFGGNNTMELCKKAKTYSFEGIDAILSSSPAYVKPSQYGIYAHYMELEKACPVPIIIYNVPGRTSSNISWQTTIKLANESKKFIGIKEATGDLIQATRILKNKPPDFFVTSGDDEVALPMIACGGQGVISVMANAFPKEFSSMIRHALNEEYKTARKLNFKLYDLHKWLYIEGNPVGIKSAMEILGLCTNQVRLPLHSMSKENYGMLKKEMEHILNY